MKENIEKRLLDEINPLTEFLGAERVDDLKDKVCTLILEQIERDLYERSDYVLIYDEDIREIAEEALEEIRSKIKKQFKNKYLAIAEKAISGISTEKGSEADA